MSGSVPTLRFLGAAGTVTGSRFLVESGGARVLVDCGLFQGQKALRLRNWAPFPVPPDSIDAVVLTHAHVDHCGYLPALVRSGFQGRVHCTEGTAELAGIVLPDSGRLNEEDAAYANRKGYSKHDPALPLFTEEDALAALEQLAPVPFGQLVEVADGVRVDLHRAGHILGSATVRLELGGPGGRRVLFTGDLGRPEHPILRPPDPRPEADVVVSESTYGNRSHRDGDPIEVLAQVISDTAARGGTVVIPAFAIDRTEVVLAHLERLEAEGRIPVLPIHLDSPMAAAALDVYHRAVDERWPDVRPGLRRDPFGIADLHVVPDVEGSKRLNELRGPMIIVSASGMVTGGRVVHHIARRIGNHRNTVLLVGFQAQQTRGRLLADGARQIKMLGHYFTVNADVVYLPAFSVHADRAELLGWLGGGPAPAPEILYAVHGEESASEALADAVTDALGWPAVVPSDGERVRLDQPAR